MTLIEDFRKEIINIIKNLHTNIPENLGDYFKHIYSEGKILFFPLKVVRSYYRAKEILRKKAENVGKLISDRQLEKILDDFLLELKYDEKGKLPEIDKHIVRLFDYLRTMEMERYLFLIPIMNIALRQDISIGNISLVNLTEDILSALEAQYSTKLRFGNDSLSKTREKLVKANNTSIYAVVIVKANDERKATELAIQRANNCLNILRLYFRSPPFVLRNEFRSELSMAIAHSNLDKKTFGEEFSAVNLNVNIPEIDSEAIKFMEKRGLKIIEKLLAKSENELTQLQKSILTAIMWFGDAVKERQKPMQLVKCFVALESVLLPNGGIAKKVRLSKRFTSIIYAEAPDLIKKRVYSKMCQLYNVRNDIIHGGETYVYEEDVSQLMLWTRMTIQLLLPYTESYENILKLIKEKFPINAQLYSDIPCQ